MYDKVAKNKPNIKLAGCLDHVRRKFFEAQKQGFPQAHYALKKIKEIYLYQHETKEAAEPQNVRIEKMLPLLKQLYPSGKPHLA